MFHQTNCGAGPRPAAAPRAALLSLFAIGLLTPAAAYAQNAPSRNFEVASVKPSPGGEFSTRPNLTRGRIAWTTQLAYLSGYAYHLDFSRVSGAHLGSIYAVEATFDPAATDDQVRLMLQSLLSDRFKMRSHPVTTEVDGSALSIGKGGLKIREAKAPDLGADALSAVRESYIAATGPAAGVIAITGRKVSMSQLAETLQRSTETPVWDRTGLSGVYDFAFRFARDLSAESENVAPSLTTVLHEDLGLELKKQKGPLVTLAVDSIEEPSAN
jgi:uncharacterized protein (TIGR03435 family)